MPTIEMRDAESRRLAARIDVELGAIVVHSRSGAGATARNPDYRPAVEAILTRLDRAGIRANVYLDSGPVAHLPMDQRRIATDAQLTGSIGDRFDYLVRSMNAGSKSHGAWRRIRFIVPGASEGAIAALLIGPDATSALERRPERLRSSELRRVTSDHVNGAVASLLAGNEAPLFAELTTYDLITPAGDRLAPKKVFGRALELAGVVAAASSYHFSAGWSQPAFELLQAAGYDIVAKAEAGAFAARRRRAAADKTEIDREAATIGVDAEERSWIEGDKRIAAHLRIERRRSGKAAQQKRAQVRAANDGRLACEHCDTDWYIVYQVGVAEAIFDVHHTKPLKDMDEGHETVVADLLCLCANCHRAEHRRLAVKSGA